MRRSSRQPGEVEILGGGLVGVPPAPEVVIELCTCGCTPQDSHAAGTTTAPEWPLAQAWAWLTRPVEPGADAPDPPPADAPDGDAEAAETGADDDVDPSSLPWWDARSGAAKRRAVLPLVLLGELQAGVLLRAVYEVVQGGGAPSA